MDVNTFIDAKYRALCQLLGDLSFKEKRIKEQKENVEAQIAQLDVMTPELRQIITAPPEDKKSEA